MSRSAIVLGSGEGMIAPDPLGLPRVRKASGDDTGGAYVLHESTRAPGQGAPPHVHGEQDEAFYVLEGAIEFMAAGERIVAPEGTFVLVPRTTEHAFTVIGDALARYLCIMSPAAAR